MRRTDHSEPTYCIVGAGAAGLAAARNFKRFGIPFEVIEREDDVGGNWAFGKSSSSVYGSTHLISSKRFSEYTDFPIPDTLPTYLSHAQAWDYLRSYARAFDLYSHIRFNRSVQKAEPRGDSWQVTFDDGSTRLYRGLAKRGTNVSQHPSGLLLLAKVHFRHASRRVLRGHPEDAAAVTDAAILR